MKYLLLLFVFMLSSCIEQKYKKVFYIGLDRCEYRMYSTGRVEFYGCESGLSYINPATYREVIESLQE